VALLCLTIQSWYDASAFAFTRIRTRNKGKVKIELEVLGLRRACQGMTSSCRLADGISLRRIDWVRADVIFTV